FDKITQKSKIYVHNQPYTTWNLDQPEAAQGYTLAQYTQKAIDLYQDNPQGFFMMVENGHTDYAGHNNDSGKMVREVLALDALVKTALDFQAKHPDETLVIVSADHETGGLKLISDQLKNVDLLKAQKMELSLLDKEIKTMIAANADPEKIYDFIIDSIGYTTPGKPVADKLMERINRALKATQEGKKNQTVKFVELVKERDRSIGFEYTTGGHSNAQIITNAQGVGAEKFAEIVENCDIPVLIEFLITQGGNQDAYKAFRERVALAKRLDAVRKNAKSSDAVKVEFIPEKTIITEIAGRTYTAGLPDFSKVVGVNVSAGEDYYLIEAQNQTDSQSAVFNLVLDSKVNTQNIDLIDLKGDLRLLPALGGGWTHESLANNLQYVLAPTERAILLLTTSKRNKLPLAAKNVSNQANDKDLPGKSLNLNLLELPATAGEPSNTDKILLKDSNGISGQEDFGSVKAFIDTRDNALNLSITVPDKDLICKNTDTAKRDTPVYDDDCVEILFGDIGTKNFYHIIINPALAIYDANSGDPNWSADLKDMQVDKDDKSWTLQVKIPLAQFKFTTFPTWNICYMNKPSGKIYNLFPVGQSGFQSPEKMSPLLVKYGKKIISPDRPTENQ
ncbi:MAG: alkaline phosphatase, partial [Victivallaceae bacterium]